MNKRIINLYILVKLFVSLYCIMIFGAGCALFDNNKGGQAEQETQAQDGIPSQTPTQQGDGLAITEKSNDSNTEQITYAGDNIPVSRALVAKMLSYIYNDSMGIDVRDRIITFSDTNTEMWYDRYINTVVQEGYMSGNGAEFMPEKALTLAQAQILLDKINPENKIKIQIDDTNKDKAISYALWTQLYFEMIKSMSQAVETESKGYLGIEVKDVIVLATPDNNSMLKAWHMVTSTGIYSYKGLSMQDYIDKKINILVKDNEIIAFLDVKDHTPTIKNAYIVNKTVEQITIFSGGAERTYAYDTSSLADGKICDIKINGSNAESVTVHNEKVTGTVKKATQDMIELVNHGQLKLSKEVNVYSIVDGVPKYKSINAVIMGSDISEYILNNGEVGAILIVNTTLPNNIRVSLNTTGFAGLIHSEVSLTSDGEFSVLAGTDKKVYNPGEVFIVSKERSEIFGGQIKRIYIAPEDSTNKIEITSIKRSNENPKYRGVIEISLEENGFSIVNELAMDQYLYAVVPSEMPTSYGLEAAKVQAVTARSYAYNQFFANRYYKYGANVDDSVLCQVYNSIPENETSIKAVDETSGQCLTYNGEVISANFFSTSSGVTANTGEVWAYNAQFPTESVEYLRSVPQYTDGEYGDLSVEENAYCFFKDMEVKSYDSQFSWFRWNVTMTNQEISASINSSLRQRYDANPTLIKTLDTNNNFRSMPVDTIGELEDIEVVKRGQGGNIMAMKITGSLSTVMVYTEYNVRMLLKPTKILDSGQDITLTMHNGSTVSNYGLLPSAFFVMDKEKNDSGSLAKIAFYGGGNGHGVGLSQNGAKGMIDQGHSFDEILKHYYPSTTITKVIGE